MLYDQGYDVWLGNNRGNVFGMTNTKLKINGKAFWRAVDIDTMASIDIPNVIDYVLHTTAKSKLSYVGHSEGTIQMFAALSSHYTLQSGTALADVLEHVVMM